MREYPGIPLTQRLIHRLCDLVPSLDVELVEYPCINAELQGAALAPGYGKFFLVFTNHKGEAIASLFSVADLFTLDCFGILDEAIAHKAEEIKHWLC